MHSSDHRDELANTFIDLLRERGCMTRSEVKKELGWSESMYKWILDAASTVVAVYEPDIHTVKLLDDSDFEAYRKELKTNILRGSNYGNRRSGKKSQSLPGKGKETGAYDSL